MSKENEKLRKDEEEEEEDEEDDTEEDQEDDEEAEPPLKYQRLSGSLPKILSKDNVATALAVSDKFIVK